MAALALTRMAVTPMRPVYCIHDTDLNAGARDGPRSPHSQRRSRSTTLPAKKKPRRQGGARSVTMFCAGKRVALPQGRELVVLVPRMA